MNHAGSEMLRKVLETAIAPDLLDQIQLETNFSQATSEESIDAIAHLLDDIYALSHDKGSEHPETLDKCQALVDLYEKTYQFAAAEKLLLRLQLAYQRTYGKENIMMSKVWNKLGEILCHEVHYVEAEEYFLKSLHLMQRFYPLSALADSDNKLHSIPSSSSLKCITSVVQSEDDGQMNVDERADSKTESESESHLASKQDKRSDNKERDAKNEDGTNSGAIETTAEMNQRLQRAQIHDMYILVIKGLAEISAHLEKPTISEAYYRQLLPMLQRKYGAQHEETLKAINALALVLETQQRSPEALSLCESSLQDCIDHLGPKHPTTQTAVSTVARLKDTLGLSAEAEAMYRLAVTYSIQALGEDHLQSLTLQFLLSQLLKKTRQYRASLDILTALEPQYAVMYGVFHLEYLQVRFLQGELCCLLDDPLQARIYFQNCYDHRCLMFRTRHHPLVYQAKFALGKTYHLECSWRHNVQHYQATLAQAKSTLLTAFFGLLAAYSRAPIAIPMGLLGTTGSSSRSLKSNRNSNSNISIDDHSEEHLHKPHQRIAEDEASNDDTFHASVDEGKGDSKDTNKAAAVVPTRHASSSSLMSRHVSVTKESLPDVLVYADSFDYSYQLQGILRSDSIELALYLGQFLVEFEFYGEAESVYRLLYDAIGRIPAPTTSNDSAIRPTTSPHRGPKALSVVPGVTVVEHPNNQHLFPTKVRAEVFNNYGLVLEHKRQYARAVLVFEKAHKLYEILVVESRKELFEKQKRLQDERRQVAAEEASTADSKVKPQRILHRQNSQETRCLDEDLTEIIQRRDTCYDQWQYAISLYNLST